MNQNSSVDLALIHKVRGLLPQFYDIVESLVIAREIRCLNETTEDGFLKSLEFPLIWAVVCEWYKLFDITDGDISWKQFTIENKKYREQIYDATGFNYQDWTAFRTKMGSLRNEIIATANRELTVNAVTDEDIESLLAILRISYRWLCENANDSEQSTIEMFRPEDFIDEFIKDTKVRLEALMPY